MKKIKHIYLVALSLIAISITVSFLLSQKFTIKTLNDANLVNVAGRQRMLSQKISKASLKLLNTNDSIVFEKNKTELKNAVKIFIKAHYTLQHGFGEFGINSVDNSETIISLFRKIDQPHKIISQAALSLGNNITFHTRHEESWKKEIEKILNYEDQFLVLMIQITDQYAFESEQRLQTLINLEGSLYLFSILILLAEVFFIFLPAFRELKRTTLRLIEKGKELEKQRVRKEYIEEIEEKNKKLEKYTYITSHDLQEPLNSIISFSTFLEESKDKLDEIGQKSVEVIKESALRMKDFIRSFLEASKLGNDKSKKEINFKTLLNNLKTDLHDLIKNKSATIEYMGKPVKIFGYEYGISKLFQNLIVNGIKYTDKETIPHIVINCEESQDFYQFSIADNGIGIEKAHYDKIFEEFGRLHTRDQYSGTGLGLSQCKNIVEMHGGKIWLESEPGKGSIFYFTISKT